jgi:hypothetical protein
MKSDYSISTKSSFVRRIRCPWILFFSRHTLKLWESLFTTLSQTLELLLA